MNRFGDIYLENKHLSFWGKFGFLIEGFPGVGTFVKSMHFKRFVNKNKFCCVLDAGSGGGEYAFYMAKKYPSTQVYGIDVDQSAIKKCIIFKKMLKLENIHFECGDIGEICDKDKYDFIYSIHALYYVKNNKTAIKKLCGALKKGGVIYINLPTRDWNQHSFFHSETFKEYLKKRDKDHIGVKYDLNELIAVLENVGCAVHTAYYQFGWLSRIAWEIDVTLSEKGCGRLKFLLLPLLKLMSLSDFLFHQKRGVGLVVVGERIR